MLNCSLYQLFQYYYYYFVNKETKLPVLKQFAHDQTAKSNLFTWKTHIQFKYYIVWKESIEQLPRYLQNEIPLRKVLLAYFTTKKIKSQQDYPRSKIELGLHLDLSGSKAYDLFKMLLPFSGYLLWVFSL